MKCEVVSVGTELLLGQVIDTNSSHIGEQLAMSGIDSHYQTKVGDNLERMRESIQTAVDRSDFVVVCGGLGPTQDDITRNAIADVMGVGLTRRDDLVERIRAVFGDRARTMDDNNLLQADLPEGAQAIPIMPGTAPGFVCQIADSVLYAVPGVPWEMMEMMDWVLEDMRQRSGFKGVIKSRVLRTWGESESGLAAILAGEIERLDNTDTATLAFLASGWEGLKIRLTAKSASEAQAVEILDKEEEAIRRVVPEKLIFGVDEDSMEKVVLDLCRQKNLKLGLAESLTGGLISSRLTAIPGASDVFQGSIVSYAKQVKADVLGASLKNLAVSEETAVDMAKGACKVLGADCALAVTGVAGPDPQEGVEPGIVWIASIVGGGNKADESGEAEGKAGEGKVETQMINFPFDRERTRQFTVITALNGLRLRLSN